VHLYTSTKDCQCAECAERGRKGYEIEHIWADHPDLHKDEFAHPGDFQEYRNRIGGLLLLPKSFNASYGDLPYAAKREHYLGKVGICSRVDMATSRVSDGHRVGARFSSDKLDYRRRSPCPLMAKRIVFGFS
jgi:uncharacterized protein DUF1524